MKGADQHPQAVPGARGGVRSATPEEIGVVVCMECGRPAQRLYRCTSGCPGCAYLWSCWACHRSHA